MHDAGYMSWDSESFIISYGHMVTNWKSAVFVVRLIFFNFGKIWGPGPDIFFQNFYQNSSSFHSTLFLRKWGAKVTHNKIIKKVQKKSIRGSLGLARVDTLI